MSTTLKFKRGNTSAAGSFLGAEGELYINTDTDQIHVHDGATTGGAAVMAKTASPTFTGAATFANASFSNINVSGTANVAGVKANGSFGTAGQLLASNGSATYWATAGNSAPDIGEIRYSADTPTNGTWLETGKYYSKSSYPDLAAKLGSIADIGSPNGTNSLMQMTPRFDGVGGPYVSATDGTTTVMVGTNGHIRYTTGTGNTTWTSVVNPSSALGMYEVRYLGGKFIAVGASSLIMTSSDGINWERSIPPTSGVLYTSVAYGSNTYVVLPATAAIGIVVSTDGGETWKYPTTQLAIAFTRVIYAGGQFVAVGASGAVYTSSDGMVWLQRTSNTAQTLNDIIYANSTYIAVGQSGAIITSPDGATWTARTSNVSGILLQVAYSGTTLVAVGTAGSIAYSTDTGATWTAVATSNAVLPNYYGVIWTGSRFATCSTAGRYLLSANGSSWTTYVDPGLGYFTVGLSVVGSSQTDIVLVSTTIGPSVHISDINDTRTRTVVAQGSGGAAGWGYRYTTSPANFAPSVAYDGVGTYVACGTYGMIMTSSDGITWTGRNSGVSSSLFSPYYVNGRWFICGASVFLMSTDGGVTWTRPASGQGMESTTTYAIAHNGTTYSVATSGGIYYSNDGATWSTANLVATYDVIWDSTNSVFVYAGNAYLGYSANGTSITQTSVAGVVFYRAIRLNGRTLVLGTLGWIYQSTNPTSVAWAGTQVAGGGTLFDAAYNSTSSTWAVCGTLGTVFSTTDFSTWTSRGVNTSLSNYRIAWTGTYWVTLSSSSTGGMYSTDLITWYLLSPCVAGTFENGAYVNGKFFAGSNVNGTMIYSTNGINWNQPTNYDPASPVIFSYARKAGGLYYLNNSASGSMFVSNNGVTWNAIKNLPPTGIHKVAYNGLQWGIVTHCNSNNMPMSFYLSNDGYTFNRVSDIGGQYAANAATLILANSLVDLTAANTSWIVKLASLTPAQGLNAYVYTSSNATSWVPRNLGTGNVVSAGWLSSNGSVAVVAVGNQSDHTGGVLKTEDGGVTWSRVPTLAYPPTYDANSGTWVIGTAASTDLVNFKSLGGGNIAQVSQFGYVISNGYLIAGDTGGASGARYISSLKGGAAVQHMTPGYTSQPTGTLNSQYHPMLVTSANTVLILPTFNSNSAYTPYGVLECNLYSYNTNTTFFVPPVAANGPAYVYAGN